LLNYNKVFTAKFWKVLEHRCTAQSNEVVETNPFALNRKELETSEGGPANQQNQEEWQQTDKLMW
jgi:hypothetical protein